MTWDFNDTFDLYSAAADQQNGYWDAGSTGASLVAGRFSNSRAGQFTNSSNHNSKTSNVNDSVHHFALAFYQTVAMGGAANRHLCIELFDGITAQCSIVFRADGAILLTSGGAGGTILDTYVGAFTLAGYWYHFEFEVVIGAAGSWAVRKNGNPVNDWVASGLNTQLSANAYANGIILANSTDTSQPQVDDFYWRSGSSVGNWLCDLRGYARMPVSDQSIQFSKNPYNPLLYNSGGSQAVQNGTAYYSSFILAANGTIGSLNLPMVAGYIGNLKCSIFADIYGLGSNNTGILLGSANVLVNPITGNNTITFPTPIPVLQGVRYWVGVDSDTTSGTYAMNTLLPGQRSTTSYAAFPVSNPAIAGNAGGLAITLFITPTDNWSLVDEAQQDARNTYVYNITPGNVDFYGIAPIPTTPPFVIATTLRAYMEKSDTGARTAAAQLKSGGTTVATPTLTLSNTSWLWAWRTDLTDPNTGSAWTHANTNNVQIGPKVVA